MPVEQYLESLHAIHINKMETLKSIQHVLKEDEHPSNFGDCVRWARLTFEKLFRNDTLRLLHNFPENLVSPFGTRFWSGCRHCPKPLDFDLDHLDDDIGMRNHLEFIISAANLRAEMYGIQGRNDAEYFHKTLKAITAPAFDPSSQENLSTIGSDHEEQQKREEEEVREILASLPKPKLSTYVCINVIEFDEENDVHMRFVTGMYVWELPFRFAPSRFFLFLKVLHPDMLFPACSNLRALSYSIPTLDIHQSRGIAGRIIPAIATTTSLVAGLSCLELYKHIGTPRKALTMDAYKNGFVNLALPFMTLYTPSAPLKEKFCLKGKMTEFTAWDQLDLSHLGNITMGALLEYFEAEYNLDIGMLSYDDKFCTLGLPGKKQVAERKDMQISDVIVSITKQKFPPHQRFIFLEVDAVDKDAVYFVRPMPNTHSFNHGGSRYMFIHWNGEKTVSEI